MKAAAVVRGVLHTCRLHRGVGAASARLLSWPQPHRAPVGALNHHIRRRDRPPGSDRRLGQAHLQEWDNITQLQMQRLIGSAHRTCQAAVASRGGHTLCRQTARSLLFNIHSTFPGLVELFCFPPIFICLLLCMQWNCNISPTWSVLFVFVLSIAIIHLQFSISCASL